MTQIETWIRDPYAIYARHILGLRALDELDADPGRAELGTVIHRRSASSFGAIPQGLPRSPRSELIEIGREQFGPDPVASRRLGFLVAALRADRPLVRRRGAGARRADIVESLSECEGSWTLPARGGPFTITAIADRIDRLADGELLLIDYKTGGVAARQSEIDRRGRGATAARRRDRPRRQLRRACSGAARRRSNTGGCPAANPPANAARSPATTPAR